MEWHCQSKVGARVIGYCAYVASILLFLGYGRQNHTQTKTPSLGYADTLQDAATGWCSVDKSVKASRKYNRRHLLQIKGVFLEV
ncbi:hypothetical protein TNCV_1966651 [Trichonephila clavipes]|nr:hypothetical protein TNCV_1966651 [Trichonephila clavipes]